MKKAVAILFAALAAMLSACSTVPYKPIAADPAIWQNRQVSIGVVGNKMPEADAEMLGNQGLLDYAINRGNAGAMLKQLQTLDLSRAQTIHKNMADALERRGFKVVRLDTVDWETMPEFSIEKEPELYAWRDWRGYAKQGVDYVLFVRVIKVGTTRTYYGFIPTGPPRSTFAAVGHLVDTKTNKMVWYDLVQTSGVVTDPWDQEPNFPNVSAAVMKSMSEGAAQFERSLFAVPAGAPPATAAAAPMPSPTPAK